LGAEQTGIIVFRIIRNIRGLPGYVVEKHVLLPAVVPIWRVGVD
jgi:hypothetical protein